MKIMFLTGGGDIGGAKTHILSLAGRLLATHDLRLVAFRDGSFAESARECGIPTAVISRGNIFSDVAELVREYDRQKPQIVHCHGAKANFMGAVLKAARGAVTVTTMHSDYKKDYMHSFFKQISFGFINSRSLRHIDNYITVNRQFADQMIMRGFDPQRIYQIVNGLDFDAPAPKLDRAEYLKSLGLDYKDGDVVCAFAARLTAVKDGETLIRGFAEAARRAPSLKLVIAGDGEERAMLERLAAELGVADSVCFAGWLKSADMLFAASDICVLSSVSEGFPYSIVEGARAKCVIVSTDVGGISTLVTHEKTGMLFAPKDYGALADCLSRLAADAELRGRLSEDVYEKAKREFSLDTMCQIQKSIYQSILKRRAAKGRNGVIICGAYGRGNAGDDAIQKAIVGQMRQIDPDMSICVMTRRPKEAKLSDRTDAFYIFNIFSFFRRISRASLFINGGGSLIQDATSSRSLYFYLFTLRAAKKRGAGVMMYGCGIGPVSGAKNRKIAAQVINSYVDRITLRDADSMNELAGMGVTVPQISLAADPAIGIKACGQARLREVLEAEGISADDKHLFVSLRSWKQADLCAQIARTCEYAYNKYNMTAVFIAAEHPKDLPVEERTAALIKTPVKVIRNKYPAEVVIGLLGSADAVLAMRLHALIFACGQGVPCAAVSYDIKVDGFMKYVGNPCVLPLQNADEDSLKRLLDSAVANGKSGSEIKQMLSEKEKANTEIAAELLA